MQNGQSRICGTCSLCCKVMRIVETEKPAGVWCGACSPGRGCKIYDTRPKECRDFSCWWLINPDLGPEWKPERSKIVIVADEENLYLRCDPGFPEAWRKEPYYSTILKWAAKAEPVLGAILVYVGAETKLIVADGVFVLGQVSPNDRLDRSYELGRLVSVKVIEHKTGNKRMTTMLPHSAAI
jgi:hypothetical protein